MTLWYKCLKPGELSGLQHPEAVCTISDRQGSRPVFALAESGVVGRVGCKVMLQAGQTSEAVGSNTSFWGACRPEQLWATLPG